MVRSPLSGQDEMPLTPPEEKTSKGLHPSGRETYSLNKISFGSHRPAEIPQNDTDYYPRGPTDRELFRQRNCECCDCDCTSDGVTGCLRRNKRCLITMTTFALIAAIILLVFGFVTFPHQPENYVESSNKSIEWEFHLHSFNESDHKEEILPGKISLSKRISKPVIEDPREPDYFVFFSPSKQMLENLDDSEDNFVKWRKKREITESTTTKEILAIRDAILERKSKYDEVLAELNEIEMSMLEIRNKFSEKAKTVFEPFSLTQSTTSSWIGSEKKDEESSEYWYSGEKRTTESVTFGGKQTEESLSMEWSFGTDSAEKNVSVEISSDLSTDIHHSTTLFHPTTETLHEDPANEPRIDLTVTNNLIDKNIENASESYGSHSTGGESTGENFIEIVSEAATPNAENDDSGTIKHDKIPDGSMEILKTEIDSISRHEPDLKPSSDVTELTNDLSATEATRSIISSKNEKNKGKDYAVKQESDEKNAGRELFYYSNSFIEPGSVVNFDVSSSDEENQYKDETVGISLAAAKEKKQQDRKPLLLNSKVVSGFSDIKYPTAPDEMKPFLNAVDSSKTSHQLSFAPSALAQYSLPYQICFYAHPAIRGKPSVRESESKTLNIENPPFFKLPHQFGSQSKDTYRFPSQQNFLSFNINNYANPGQSSHFPPSAGSIYTFSSPHHFAQLFNGAPFPQQPPLFCTYLQPPLIQFPTVVGSGSDFGQPKCASCGEEFYDPMPSSKELNLLSDKGLSCLENTISCRDGLKCIAAKNWCDNRVHCNDASDEIFCSCRERLAPERLCDGYADCPLGEDEVGCFDCSKSSFRCDSFDKPRACISNDKQCDGVRDCPSGKDEVDCTALFPKVGGDYSHHGSYSKGFLHRNWKGDWYPVCVEIEENLWANEACLAETGMASRETKVLFAQVSDNYKGPFVVRQRGNEVGLQEHCKGHVMTYVICPEIKCGTRITSNDNDRIFQHFVRTRRNDFAQRREDVKEEVNAKFNVENIYWKEKPSEKAEYEEREDKKEKREKGKRETSRVVGGKESEPRAWPWVIALYKNGDFHCGGVILDERWILTAAHCVDHYWKNYYEIRSGMLRRFSFSPMEQVREVSDVVVHEMYNKSIMSNDVALLRLQTPLHFNRWVRPACLPSLLQGDSWGPLPGTRCIAIGWGAVKEGGSNPDQMREVEIPILSKCRHTEDIVGDEICAGITEGGRDTCQGDSGGPLLCRDSRSAWYVAGIVSHGEGCARPREPGAYTRVSLFVDWIIANSNDFQLPSRKPVAICPGFRCTSASRRCISGKWLCNGLVDCLNGEDELKCEAAESLKLDVSGGGDDDVDDGSKLLLTETLMQMNKKMTDSNLFEEINSEKKSAQAPVARSLKEVSEITSYVVKVPKINKEQDKSDGDNSIDGKTTEIMPLTNHLKTGNEKEVIGSPKGDFISLEPTSAGFRCRKIIQTVKEKHRCDGVIDCEDGTDEEFCNCRDFLLKTKPDSICDGIADCKDLTDEKRCFSCFREEFTCGSSGQCLPKSKVCDNVNDCTFGEDEKNCFALASIEEVVTVDGNGKPTFRMTGKLMMRKGDVWSPMCQKNNAMEMAIRACSSFGSSGYESYGNGTDDSANCRTLNVACSDRLTSELTYYGSNEEGYRWPWHAIIYADGKQICSAALLSSSWLLTALECVKHISFRRNHVVAKLGSKFNFKGMLELGMQIIRISGMKRIPQSDVVLLNLSRRVNITWYVRPLQMPFMSEIGSGSEWCVAVGEDTVFLKSSSNCPGSSRCFGRMHGEKKSCRYSRTQKSWTGVVVCQSELGWYPASVYHEPAGFCGSQFYIHGNVLDKLKEIKHILGSKIVPLPEIECDGIRCTEGECIPKSKVCDGKADCSANEDETFELCSRNNHTGTGCGVHEMLCANGICILKTLFGNGVDDCGDGSDEPTSTTCLAYMEVTSPERICDGIANCYDKSDEHIERCGCASSKFNCSLSPDLCIPYDFVCDGEKDCPGGEDEASCVGYKTLDSRDNAFSHNQASHWDMRGELRKELEIIHMSYGVWHSLCSVYISEHQTKQICEELGYKKGFSYLKNQTRISPVLDPYSSVKLNSKTSVILRKRNEPFARSEEAGSCQAAVVRCE